MVATLANLDSVRLIDFKPLAAPDRTLVAIEAGRDMPYEAKRVFTITARKLDLVGGRHAHRLCSQLLVAVTGACDVICRADPAEGERRFRLERPEQGLLIPPSVWAEQLYLADPTVLMVLCDRVYEAEDYIRDFDAFLAYRAAA
jgi:hypothetical protein